MKIGDRVSFYNPKTFSHINGTLVESDECDEMFDKVAIKCDDTNVVWSVPRFLLREQKSTT